MFIMRIVVLSRQRIYNKHNQLFQMQPLFTNQPPYRLEEYASVHHIPYDDGGEIPLTKQKSIEQYNRDDTSAILLLTCRRR